MPIYTYSGKYLGTHFLESLIRECDNTSYDKKQDYFRKRDKALVATLFLTGGSVLQVVRLRKDNFVFEDEQTIRVRNMRLTGYKREKGKRRKLFRTFPIFRDDPLIQYLLDWLPEVDDYLFPSPKKARSHLGRGMASKIIADLGKRIEESIKPIDLRKQRMCYLHEKRGYSVFKIQEYFHMRRAPSIFKPALAPVTRKPQETPIAEKLNFPNGILEKLPPEVGKTIEGVMLNYQNDYPRFCFGGMRTALIDAIRIRFIRDGKKNELYDQNQRPYKLSKWIELAKKEGYISSNSADFLKRQAKVFGDISLHDFMADLHKKEVPSIFTQLRMALARMYYKEKSRSNARAKESLIC